MQKFPTIRINAKTETGIAEHTDKYPVPTGEDPNQYIQAEEVNTLNEKINENTEDVKDLMIFSNEVVNDYQKKQFKYGYEYHTITGENAVIHLHQYGFERYTLTDDALVSVAGFDLASITGNSSAEVPYEKKPIRLTNKTGADIVLKNNFTGTQVPFLLKNDVDLVLPNNETIEFEYKYTGGISLKEVFKSWSDNVIKSTQLLIFQANGNTTTSIENIQAGDLVIGFVQGTFLNAGEYTSGDPLTLSAYGM